MARKARIKSEINVEAKAEYSQLEKLNQSLARTQKTIRNFSIGITAVVPLLSKLSSSAMQAATAAWSKFCAQAATSGGNTRSVSKETAVGAIG